MKIVSIVGTRPNFIKMITVFLSLQNTKHEHIIVQTGQHYDTNMSDLFFQELNLPVPQINLNVGSGTHGFQTGEILKSVEKILLQENPDIVLVPGDTNSNLAGALAAAKLQIKVAHIEAGLRSYDRTMPEEINRVVIDHCSTLLFCPTNYSVKNLKKEGIEKGVFFVGDTMLELGKLAKKQIKDKEFDFDLPKEFILATIHRDSNTRQNRLKEIITELSNLDHNVILPIHPRTKNKLIEMNLYKSAKEKIQIIDPVGFLIFTKMLMLTKAIITDSGGVQKEAYWNGKPCITVRPNTEWIDTIQKGGNILAEPNEIIKKTELMLSKEITFDKKLYGFDDTSKRILRIIESELN